MKPLKASQRLSNPQAYICRSCLSSRSYSTSSNPPSPPSSGYALLSTRRLISLSGPDSTKFLQGAITANVSATKAHTSGFFAAFLNAQGRLLNDVFLYPVGKDGHSWLIEVDNKEVDKLAKHIKKYKLRAKFDVKVVDEGESRVWSVWKEEGWRAHSLSSATESRDGESEVGCEDARAPGMGRRLILSAGTKPEVDAEETDESSYRIRRYLRGVPEGQDELLREASLPQESNVDFMGGVDYRKGCYVGQELTIRTHHTGVVRKRVLPVMLYGPDEPMPNSLEYDVNTVLDAQKIPLETSIGRFEKRGRSAGKWLAGVGNIGLGLCRLEIMTDVVVQGEAGGYKEGDEFKLEWQLEGSGPEMVKVKAFVPSWHPQK